MSKKTEANLDKIRELEDRVRVDVPMADGYGSRCIKTKAAIRMILDHLGLAYEPGVPAPSKLIKVLKK